MLFAMHDAIIVLAWKGTFGSKLLFLPYVMAFNCCSGRFKCLLGTWRFSCIRFEADKMQKL